MGIFDSLKKAASGIFADVEKTLSRMTTKDALERVVGAAYLIARADGTIDDSEKVTLGKVVQRKLPQFSNSEVAGAFAAVDDLCALSWLAGRREVIENIAKARGTDDAPTIMLAVLAVAEADGTFDDSERTVAREICQKLGLSTSEYGL